MLAYLILAGFDGRPIDPDLIAQFDQDDPPEVPFHPEERIIWRNRDGSVVFFGWQTFTEVAGIGSHWAVDEVGLTAFTGHCWPHTTGWAQRTGKSWAAQLRSHLRDTPDLQAARESFFGNFTIVSLPDTGVGWVVPDWANLDQLFFADRSSGSAVSNRAGLCARAVTTTATIPPRSLTAAGWLISKGSIPDQESSYWDVDRPQTGSYVAIDPARGAKVIEPRWSPLFPPAPDDPPLSYEELLNEVEQDLRSTIRAIAALPLEERVLSLSGGKDSRTLLAIIMSEGVQDRFRFVTTGSPERADAIAARAVATRFGLDWSLQDLTARTPEEELENTRLYMGLVEGMTSAWQTMDRPAFSTGVTVSGTAGEGLLWTASASATIDTATPASALKAMRKRRPTDQLGVLRPEVRAYYDAFVSDAFHEMAARGIPPVSLAAIYRYDEFLHGRYGPDAASNPHMRILPYATPVCIRINHRLPLDSRPDPRFHVDLQRRCAPELSKLPFAEWTWPESAIAHLPDADEYRQIRPVLSQNLDGRTWRQKRYADYRPVIESIVLDRSNPIHELLDYGRLTDRLATGDAHPGRTRLMWGVFSAAVWIGQHERQIKIERSGDAQPRAETQ
jgi:hypothetical protein